MGRLFGNYGQEFVERAVALGEEIGVTRAAQILGLGSSQLSNWVQAMKKGQYVKKIKSAEELKVEQENRKLKRENDELKKANIILKEVVSVFSKDRPDSDSRRSLKSANEKKNR